MSVSGGSGTPRTMSGVLGPAVAIPGLAGYTVGDLWSWAYSTLVDNTVRPVFAEFMVGVLIGATSSGRLSWDAADLRCDGKLVEVKSAAYVQAWEQSSPSRIEFDIARKKAWTASTNTWADTPARSADCYVFCLYPEQDVERANPLDETAWKFWVLPTERIEQEFGAQRQVALSRITKLAQAVPATRLRDAVHNALDSKRAE